MSDNNYESMGFGDILDRINELMVKQDYIPEFEHVELDRELQELIQIVERKRDDELHTSHIALASSVVGKNLGLDGEELDCFIGEMLGINNGGIVQEVRKYYAELKELKPEILSYNAKIAIEAMAAIHQTHIQELQNMSVSDLVDSGHVDNLRGDMHSLLPLEVAGWDVAKRYFPEVQSVFDTIGMQINEDSVKRECDNVTIRMLAECGKYQDDGKTYDSSVYEYDNVQEYILFVADFHTTSVDSWMFDKNFIENTIMPDVINHGIGADKDIMDRVDEMQIEPFGTDGAIVYTPGNRD